jgi:hypothetical protein
MLHRGENPLSDSSGNSLRSWVISQCIIVFSRPEALVNPQGGSTGGELGITINLEKRG